MKKERINYLDLIKTIAIIFVVFVHYSWDDGSIISNISMMLCIIAVPLFFMVNGTLLLNNKFDLNKHLKKMLNIYLGIVSFKILIFVIYYIIGIGRDVGKLDFIYYLFFNRNIVGISTEHFWFIFSLLKIYFVYPFIKIAIDKKENNNKTIVCILIFLFCLSFLPELLNTINVYFLKLNNFNPWIIKETFSPIFECEYLFYFVFGYTLHKKYYKTGINKKSVIIITTIIIIAIMGIISLKLLQDGSLSGVYNGINNKYLKISNLLLSSSLFVLLSKIDMDNSKIVNYIGSRTMNIYCIHMLIVSFMFNYLLPKINLLGFIPNLIKTIIAIVISIVLTELMKKSKYLKKVFNLS